MPSTPTSPFPTLSRRWCPHPSLILFVTLHRSFHVVALLSAPAVAEVLLEWLATLGEPVIPQDLFPLEGFQHAGAAAW